jgi:hypothetical protein
MIISGTRSFLRHKVEYLKNVAPVFQKTKHLISLIRTSLLMMFREIRPITVAARSEAGTVFPRSNAWIVGSNPTRSMDVCMRLFCVCVVVCAGSGLATG